MPACRLCIVMSLGAACALAACGGQQRRARASRRTEPRGEHHHHGEPPELGLDRAGSRPAARPRGDPARGRRSARAGLLHHPGGHSRRRPVCPRGAARLPHPLSSAGVCERATARRYRRPSGWSARSPSRPPTARFTAPSSATTGCTPTPRRHHSHRVAQQAGCTRWATSSTSGASRSVAPRWPSAKGKVTAFLNGKRWSQDPRAIPLLPHASIQLDVGAPTVSPRDHLVRRDESLGLRRGAAGYLESNRHRRPERRDRSRLRFPHQRARRARPARRSTRRDRCPPPTARRSPRCVIR